MKKKKKRFLLTMVFLFSFLISLLLFSGMAMAESWTQDATGGFGNANNINVSSMAVYGSQLYMGTENSVNGCEVWAFDGANWSVVVGPGAPVASGFGTTNNNRASSMATYGGVLYVGTWNPTSGCEVWAYNGFAWNQVVGGGAPGTPSGPGFGNANNTDAYSMAVYGGQLYMGTENGANGCNVWRYDGTFLTQVVGQSPPGTPGTGPGFGNGFNSIADSMAAFGADLFVGTQNTLTGCEVWSYDGTSWAQVVGQGAAGTPTGPGFGDGNNIDAISSAVFSGQLHMGTINGATGCEVWRYDGANWTQVVGQSPPGTPGTGPGFGKSANFEAYEMSVYGGCLYVGVTNLVTGCEVWRYDGTTWTQVVGQGAAGTPTAPGFGNGSNWSIWGTAVYDLGLFWGTWNNATGCEVWSTKTSPTWFLAEGATLGGFETWILVQNPNTFPVTVDIRFQTSSGEVQGPQVLMPAQSRVSYLANTYVTDYNVSTKVTANGGDVICERAVYWTPPDTTVRMLGHDSIGVPTSSMTWFLAEGATLGGFETWILVQNPNPDPVDIDIDYMTSAGPVQGPLDQIPAQSRKSYLADTYVSDFDVSTQVTSLTPGGEIICERAMYWTPPGETEKVLGHDSRGATTLGSTWYLAEGATLGGFETWILVQNPNPNPVNIDIKFQTGGGQVQGPIETIFPQSRKSYRVNNYMTTYDVSTQVDSFGGDVICERAMYWTPPGETEKVLGHDSIGVRNNGGLNWYLAEGATLGGFETWILVQNPNPNQVSIDMQFQTELGQMQGPVDTIPAQSRKSYNVGPWVTGYNVSTQVTSTAGGFIICERAMYWTPFPTFSWLLGHDSIGFDP